MKFDRKIGDTVRWYWGNGSNRGRIIGKFDHPVSRTIEQLVVVKNGSTANPAYLVRLEDGSHVLRYGSEFCIN
jgi:hypothetical protein